MARRTSETPQIKTTTPARQHEERDLSFPVVLSALALIVLFAFVIHGALWGWLTDLNGPFHAANPRRWQSPAHSGAQTQSEFAKLQVHPQSDLAQARSQHLRQLQSYAWVKPDAGVVHLPIERSMRLIAAQGLPEWVGPRGRVSFPKLSSGTNAPPPPQTVGPTGSR